MDREFGDPYTSYQWFFGKEVAVNTEAVQAAGPYRLMLGISLAGPDLTPETFADRHVPLPARDRKHAHVRPPQLG